MDVALRCVRRLSESDDDNGRAVRPSECLEHHADLKRQFFSAGEMVLFAPDFAVIFGSHFEEFIPSVSRKLTALVSQLFRFGSREWFEIRGDS